MRERVRVTERKRERVREKRRYISSKAILKRLNSLKNYSKQYK